MKTTKRVKVEDAPGYSDFCGWEYDTFAAVDDRGSLSVIIDEDDEIWIIPSKHVTYVTD